jgi:hypothetical protein
MGWECDKKNTYRILVEGSIGKRPFGRLRNKWEDSIKMDLRETVYEDRRWMEMA